MDGRILRAVGVKVEWVHTSSTGQVEAPGATGPVSCDEFRSNEGAARPVPAVDAVGCGMFNLAVVEGFDLILVQEVLDECKPDLLAAALRWKQRFVVEGLGEELLDAVVAVFVVTANTSYLASLELVKAHAAFDICGVSSSPGFLAIIVRHRGSGGIDIDR